MSRKSSFSDLVDIVIDSNELGLFLPHIIISVMEA